jgi:hypothetical protein
MTARRRRKAAAPVDLYDEHCRRVAREAEGWIAAHGRGAWRDEMAARRAHQNALDLITWQLDAQVIADDRHSRPVEIPADELALWSVGGAS